MAYTISDTEKVKFSSHKLSEDIWDIIGTRYWNGECYYARKTVNLRKARLAKFKEIKRTKDEITKMLMRYGSLIEITSYSTRDLAVRIRNLEKSGYELAYEEGSITRSYTTLAYTVYKAVLRYVGQR